MALYSLKAGSAATPLYEGNDANDTNGLSLVNAAGTVIWSLTPAGMPVLPTANSPALQTIGAAGTITLPTVGAVAKVTATAARTGIILTPGTFDGQVVRVMHVGATAANSLTFDVVGTSNVQAGVACIIGGGTYKDFVWVASIPAWVATSQAA